MEIINPFKDQNIEIVDLPVAEDSRFGSSLLNSAKELQIGNGSNVFRGDQSGIWLGAKTFALAPFSVAMDGSVIATGLTISGYVPVGGSASDINSNVTTISGGKITTGSISTDKLIAGEITGFTITGGLIQTSSSGLRTVLDSSDDKIKFMNSTSVYGSIYPYQSGGDAGIYMQASTSNAFLYLQTGSGGNIAQIGADTSSIWFSGSSCIINGNTEINDNLTVQGDLFTQSSGSVTSGGSSSSPFPSGWSVSNIATGRYTVTHNFGTTSYAVNITVVSSIAKVWAVESKGTNSFTVRIANTSFTLENNAFDFLVFR